MNRVVLVLAIAASSYATSYVAPDPGLKRLAPDRAEPRHRVLHEGFWGADGKLLLIGPDLMDFIGNSKARALTPYPQTINFDADLKDNPAFRRIAADPEQRGFLRSVPSVWYGVRADVPDRLVPDYRAAGASRFYLFNRRQPTIPAGWRLLSERLRRTDLGVVYPNPAIAGGGIGVMLQEPKGWRLSDIGLVADEDYVVGFRAGWDSPYSTWDGPKPKSERAVEAYQMVPRVLAEISEVTIENVASGEHREVMTPTGWVEAAGRFSRSAPSGLPSNEP